MKLFIIAGEPSGDLHAANCLKFMLSENPSIDVAYTGGSNMKAVCGKEPVVHIDQMAFMGFVEVLANLSTIRRNFKKIKEHVLDFKPDALLLVDYPGFNLKMAQWAFRKKIRVYYYISPTVWAWKENRAEIIRKCVRKLFVILPFEKEFYRKKGIEVSFQGHPLLDAIDAQTNQLPDLEKFRISNKLSPLPIIAVLPGSRKQEIERMIETMLKVKNKFPGYQFVIAGSTNLPENYYELAKQKQVPVLINQTYALMTHAVAGIIKSGTSTLESALLKLPQVVCYKAGNVSFSIAKLLVKIKYISLVNLILDKPCVKELVQQDCTAENIEKELNELLHNTEYRNTMLNEYEQLYQMLGGTGASERIAINIIEDITIA